MNDNVLLMNKGHLKREDKIDFNRALEAHQSLQLRSSFDNHLGVKPNTRIRKVKTKKSNRSARRNRNKSKNISSRKIVDFNEAYPFRHKALKKISSQHQKSQFFKDKRNNSYLVPRTGNRFAPSKRNFFFSDKNVSVQHKKANPSTKLSDFADSHYIKNMALSKQFQPEDDFIARDVTMKDIIT